MSAFILEKIDKNFKDSKFIDSNLDWYDVLKMKDYVKGLYWFKTNNSFSRLDDNLEVRDNLKVLSLMPSGGYLEFESDTDEISLDVELEDSYFMPHMTAIGQAGFDLYAKFGEKFIYLASTKTKEIKYRYNLYKSDKKELRTYRIYLPMYIKILSLSLGLGKDGIIRGTSENKGAYIVCYGTSITQGGCATRPGMNYTSILERHIDYRVLNLGFSGNAHLDSVIAKEIVKINPEIVIIEAIANCLGKDFFEENLKEFIKIVSRKASVIVTSYFPSSSALMDINKDKLIKESTKIIKKVIKEINNENVYFLDGFKILKELDYEETVDGIHLTDLGFYFLAMKLRDKIKKIKREVERKKCLSKKDFSY